MHNRLISLVLTSGLALASVARAADPTLIGWWKLDDGSGTAAVDSSGQGRNGTLLGGPTWSMDGVLGGCLVFDGSDDYVVVNGSFALPQYSVALWFRQDSGTGAQRDLISVEAAGQLSGILLEVGTDGRLRFLHRAPLAATGGSSLYTTSSPDAGSWHHMAAVKSDSQMVIYLDGEAVVSQAETTQFDASPTLVYIGILDTRMMRPWPGPIDDVRLYNRALAESDIPAVMKGGEDTTLASKPSPEDKATDAVRDVVLGWNSGQFAKTHDVYFGTSFDDVNNASRTSQKGVLASQDQDATAFDPAGLLAFGQTYYWRIDEVNAAPDNTVYKGKTWSLTAETYGYVVKPTKATASSVMTAAMGPEKTIDGSGLDSSGQHSTTATQMWLSKKNVSPVWIQYEFDKTYKLYQMWVWNSNQAVEGSVGFGAKDVTVETSTDGTTWTALADVPEFADATGEPNYTHNTTVDFGGAQAKYVKLTIHSNWADGTKQAGLSEVRFFYVPVKAYGPNPASAGTGVAVDGVLNWRPGREAVKHQVYLGTDPSALTLVNTVTAHSLGLGSLGLLYGKTYYWKVNEVNDAGSPSVWEGDVWSFTTITYAVVDDFEQYDDVCKRIFFSWVDGFGYSASADCSVAASAGNATGSTVGNVSAPFAERKIVHGGTQSMPMAFDNTKSPYYSETQREWTDPQAWTGGGVNTLVVYVRGDAPAFLETSPGTLLMNGMGTDIWNAADQFRFAYKSLKGNGSIVARVDSVSNPNEWAKAGVMIRQNLDSGSTFAIAAATPTPSHGISFQYRTTAGATPSNTDVNMVSTPGPYWVKLTRTGDTFTAQRSVDGVAWVDITVTPAVTVAMGSDVLIGLAVCSHVTGTPCGAKFSNVSTTGGVSGSWQVAEIGVAQVNGNTPETFYVALQDNTGTTKVVSNPDPTVIALGAWQEWTIPLSQFASAGVKVGSIKKMVVGIGDRSSPKAGNAGKVYIDDIRLTRVAAP